MLIDLDLDEARNTYKFDAFSAPILYHFYVKFETFLQSVVQLNISTYRITQSVTLCFNSQNPCRTYWVLF